MKRRTLLAAAALAGCAAPRPLHEAEMPPPAPREFRAAWVATVANIDWPSRPGLAADEQRAQAIALLDRARSLRLNAIVLQVRPAADALYASTLEPWSEYLGGVQGQAPGYDPLGLWVNEAHRRGVELHAWFNPYRARHPSAKGPADARHVSRRRADLVRAYGELLWLDPAEDEAASHTLAVIADVVRRYDVDGVHVDDYFYPYPVAGGKGGDLPFPDDAAWQRYRGAGGGLARDDWRRDKVSRFVRSMYEQVHAIKPEVKVGISPFGLPRPDRRPPGIEGFSQYDRLFADVERWVDEGWFDYLAPQLYWPLDRREQAFAVLADHWARSVGARRHLWPGLFTSSVGAGAQPWSADEVLAQLWLLRRREGIGGHLHFSMVALAQDRDGVATRLAEGPYRGAALVPPTPWLGAAAPAAPVLRQGLSGGVSIEGDAALWALWQRRAGRWHFAVQAGSDRRLAAASLAGADALVASAVGRTGIESARSAIRLRD